MWMPTGWWMRPVCRRWSFWTSMPRALFWGSRCFTANGSSCPRRSSGTPTARPAPSSATTGARTRRTFSSIPPHRASRMPTTGRMRPEAASPSTSTGSGTSCGFASHRRAGCCLARCWRPPRGRRGRPPPRRRPGPGAGAPRGAPEGAARMGRRAGRPWNDPSDAADRTDMTAPTTALGGSGHLAASRFTPHASRLTFHASRVTSSRPVSPRTHHPGRAEAAPAGTRRESVSRRGAPAGGTTLCSSTCGRRAPRAS